MSILKTLLALVCLLPLLIQAELAAAMKIASQVFAQGEMIPARFTCDGANANPRLDIAGVPAGARSLALVVDDPDAPAGTWNHWLLWNINQATTVIAGDSVPTGAIQGRSDFGQKKYIGPSPPSGTH
jgi:Raf kinase inhibitor-like YbhB/YbcL family protein